MNRGPPAGGSSSRNDPLGARFDISSQMVSYLLSYGCARRREARHKKSHRGRAEGGKRHAHEQTVLGACIGIHGLSLPRVPPPSFEESAEARVTS